MVTTHISFFFTVCKHNVMSRCSLPLLLKMFLLLHYCLSDTAAASSKSPVHFQHSGVSQLIFNRSLISEWLNTTDSAQLDGRGSLQANYEV